MPCHRVAGWGLGFYSRCFPILLPFQVLDVVSARFSYNIKRQSAFLCLSVKYIYLLSGLSKFLSKQPLLTACVFLEKGNLVEWTLQLFFDTFGLVE